MAKFDVVIVGGGHNGITTAAYLAKCGLSVCVCEERSEIGGAQENTEPIPGFRIDPHASYMYGYVAPGFEQLELWKYGFRMVYYKTMMGGMDEKGKAYFGGRYNEETVKSVERISKRDAKIWEILVKKLEPNVPEILRSIFWTPPFPPEMEVEMNDLPWAKLFQKYVPQLYFPEWNEMTCLELIDFLFESDIINSVATIMWYSGASPNWEGMAIPSLAGFQMWYYASGCPRGGMHAYAHAIARCAIAHGARILTNCPVESIIVQNGEAKGVKLSRDAAFPEKVIWAEKAVISDVPVTQTFLNLLDYDDLEHGFIRRIKDISIKGGSLWVLSLITKELPRFAGEGAEVLKGDNFPCLSSMGHGRDKLMAHLREAYSFKTSPKPENAITALMIHDIFDSTRCPPGYHVFSPCYMQVVPPEYHVKSPDAVNAMKEEILEWQMEHIRQFAPNFTKDKIVAAFVNTPYDSEIRNAGLLGGNWYATRHCKDQWWSSRPLPELSRYRTPVKKLYLCNQTSYPGGLCLMAVPYNLMHILIEDLSLKLGSWWYPSPWHVPDREAEK